MSFVGLLFVVACLCVLSGAWLVVLEAQNRSAARIACGSAELAAVALLATLIFSGAGLGTVVSVALGLLGLLLAVFALGAATIRGRAEGWWSAAGLTGFGALVFLLANSP